VPTGISLFVARVSAADELQSNAGGYRWWDVRDRNSTELPLETQQDISLDLSPGSYLVTITVWWDGTGDVVYGFLVEVR
jgi:hypothetical protein